MNLKLKMTLFRRLSVIISIIGFFTLLSARLLATTIHSCELAQNKCVIKLEDGAIGDRVEVTDLKGRSVAEGFIVRRQGPYAVITLKYKVAKPDIKSGDPVLIKKDSSSSNAQWAATF